MPLGMSHHSFSWQVEVSVGALNTHTLQNRFYAVKFEVVIQHVGLHAPSVLPK